MTLVRHPLLVRLTHWMTAISFIALLVSGIAILLAHPRLYWGETGAVGTPSLIDLPLPFLLTGQSGWGRSLHFLSAWISVATGLLYVASYLVTRRFRTQTSIYSVVQRYTYRAVVFALFPLMIWTGLAMSPAITSVMPVLVEAAGGQQSARTIHFIVAAGLIVFLIGHIVMVFLSGFIAHMRGMITGEFASGARSS